MSAPPRTLPVAPTAAVHAPVQPHSDVEARIIASGCAVEYFALEDCLGEHGRVWSACRAEVSSLRVCDERKQLSSAEAAAARPVADK